MFMYACSYCYLMYKRSNKINKVIFVNVASLTKEFPSFLFLLLFENQSGVCN